MKKKQLNTKQILKKENAKWPDKLVIMPKEAYPPGFKPPKNIKEVWRSKNYLVQIYNEGKNERLSICSTMFDRKGWIDRIPWEILQELKAECGRGDKTAVELYPADEDIVNVANFRHLWVLAKTPDYGWSKPKKQTKMQKFLSFFKHLFKAKKINYFKVRGVNK